MKKREKKLCALLLGITMLCSGLPTGMLHVPAAETGTQKSAGQSYTKTKNVTVVDTLAGGKGSEWFNENDGVTFSDGNLNVYDDNNSAASVMRNIGNGDFTAEIHWSDFKASASGNSGVMMLRIRADKDSEDDLVEIDRFSDGNLKLLVKSKTKPVVNNVVTSSNFNANEGWFKISYKSSTKMVTAEYKVSESDSYQTMTSGQAAMDNFGGTHILEVRAQAWNGNVSANIKQVNSTFVKTADYKYHETEEYVNPKQPDLWYGGEGAEYVQGTGFRLTGTDNGIARVKRDIGDQDLSAEIKWGVETIAASEEESVIDLEEKSIITSQGAVTVVSEGAVQGSADTPKRAAMRTVTQNGAILRISQNDANYAQLEKKADQNEICFTVVQNGQKFLEKTMPYNAVGGWFRIDYDHATHEVDAYYREADSGDFTFVDGGRTVADGLAGKHVLELMADKGTAAAFGMVDIAYNQALALGSDQFKVEVDGITGGVYQLSNPSDGYGTNYVMNPSIHPAYNIDDSRWVGDLTFSVKKGGGAYGAQNTSLSDDSRETEIHGDKITVSYNTPSQNQAGIRDFALEESYELNEAGDQLSWQIHIRNTSGDQLEIGDLGIPLLMNSWWDGGNQTGIYEQNVARHSFVAKDGSYIYWQRPNGDGSFLVMTPQDGTSLEFKDKANDGPFGESDPAWEGLVEYYIHSQEITKRLADRSYLNPSTSLTLAAGEEKTYGFTFQWAKSYADLRDILYNAGIVDAVSYPGMVIPQGTTAALALRCKEPITDVTGDKSDIQIEKKEDKNGYSIYDITFSTVGSNNITIRYGAGKESVLQYYSTEPIEELIEKNTDFLVSKQQSKDTDRGFNGAYLQWDMKNKCQVTWEHAESAGYWNRPWMAGGSDDLGLAPAVYLSEKNITAPDKKQIESLEYYLENFIWEFMQNHKTYEVHHWYNGNDQKADTASWRSYNYVHVANTYYNMYQIAKNYPNMSQYLTANAYLRRCYNTLKAYFTYPMFAGTEATKKPPMKPETSGAYVFGNMGEMNLPAILNALQEEGYSEEYTYLSERIDEKVQLLFKAQYPFASEMSIDTTGFESCYTLAKMKGLTDIVEKTTKASLACRGMQPLWYFCGSDNRHMGESWWNLGYETQLGAWQQQDYLYTYADPSSADFDDIMRGTYSAYLAGWSNINVGQIDHDPANIGAAAWQYQSERGTVAKYGYIPISKDGWWLWSGEASLGFWGGVKTACANIVDDNILGVYGYGCNLDNTDGSYTITPTDGVRTRFVMYNKGKFGMQLSKARYTKAVVADDLQTISLALENVAGRECDSEITFSNLPAGKYEITSGGKTAGYFESSGDTSVVQLKLAKEGQEIQIQKIQGGLEDITNSSGNLMNACMPNSSELMNLLTEADKALISNSGKIQVELRASQVAEDQLPAQKELAKQAIEKLSASQYTEGAYMDLSMYKAANGGEPEIIAKAEGEVTIQLTLPADLINTDESAARTYKVIRIGDGKEAILDTALYGSKLTFGVDQSCVYVLVYLDTKDQPSDPGSTGGSSGGSTGGSSGSSTGGSSGGSTGGSSGGSFGSSSGGSSWGGSTPGSTGGSTTGGSGSSGTTGDTQTKPSDPKGIQNKVVNARLNADGVYIGADGNVAANVIVKDPDGKKYIAGADGRKVSSGFVDTTDGTTYYVKTDGTVAQGGIVKVSGAKYLAQDGGAIAKDGFFDTVKGSTVYAYADGKLASDKVIRVDGKKYFVKKNCAVAKNGFYTIPSGSTVYAKSNGELALNKVITHKGKKFFDKASGVIAKGGFYKTVSGNKVYAKKSGVLVTGKIFSVKGAKYYAGKSGAVAVKKWVKIGNKKYYCSVSGKITKVKKIRVKKN